MRKAFGLLVLGCCLVVGLACTQDASAPTQPAASTSELQSFSLEVTAGKTFLCHWNESDGTGVVVEVTANTVKTHKKHIALDLDCYCPNSPAKSGAECNNFDGTDDICDSTCPSP